MPISIAGSIGELTEVTQGGSSVTYVTLVGRQEPSDADTSCGRTSPKGSPWTAVHISDILLMPSAMATVFNVFTLPGCACNTLTYLDRIVLVDVRTVQPDYRSTLQTMRK